MLFLVRRCNLHARHCRASVVNLIKQPDLWRSIFLNVESQFFPAHYKLFSSNTNLPIPDVKLKKYFDYLSNAYKNNDLRNEAATDLLRLPAVSNLLKERIATFDNMKSLKDIVTDDAEMQKLAKEEEVTYTLHLDEIDKKLLDIILQNLDKQEYKSAIMELTPGVGGQEAMLFVKDLYNMYVGYLEYLGLQYDVMELDITDNNGLRKVSILINGSNILDKLKYEIGIHRVQRVPATERQGRLHTSTASVVVLPEPTDVQIELPNKDLKIEAKKASGAGGQHVNTTNSAIRVLHIPTGTVVTCQMDRSQIKNREWALRKLRILLYEDQMNKQLENSTNLRKKQEGMKLRSDRIRTYNYTQNRVTDHRLSADGTVHNLKVFMEGGAGLEELVNRLRKDSQAKILLEIVQNLESQLK